MNVKDLLLKEGIEVEESQVEKLEKISEAVSAHVFSIKEKYEDQILALTEQYEEKIDQLVEERSEDLKESLETQILEHLERYIEVHLVEKALDPENIKLIIKEYSEQVNEKKKDDEEDPVDPSTDPEAPAEDPVDPAADPELPPEDPSTDKTDEPKDDTKPEDDTEPKEFDIDAMTKEFNELLDKVRAKGIDDGDGIIDQLESEFNEIVASLTGNAETAPEMPEELEGKPEDDTKGNTEDDLEAIKDIPVDDTTPSTDPEEPTDEEPKAKHKKKAKLEEEEDDEESVTESINSNYTQDDFIISTPSTKQKPLVESSFAKRLKSTYAKTLI